MVIERLDPAGAAADDGMLAHDVSPHFLEALGVAVYTTDAQGIITSFNEAAAELWGRRPELGKDLWCGSWRLYYTDGRPMAHGDCPMGIALKEDRAVRGGEAIAERPDGTRVWFVPYPTPLHDAAGTLTGAVNVLVDVTARRHAELALQESQARLELELAATQRLQASSSQLIREDDVDAVYERILDAAVGIMHSDMASIQIVDEAQDALRLLSYRGFGPGFRDVYELVGRHTTSACGAARESGERVVIPDVETCDFIVGTSGLEDHRTFDIRAVQSTPLCSRSGELLGMISTHWRAPHTPTDSELRLLDVLARQAADLLERARAEAALREQAVELQDFFENSGVAFHWLGPDGIILRANQAEFTLTGYAEDEYIGRNIAEFHAERVTIEDMFARLTRGEELHDCEAQLRCKDGSIKDVLIDSSVLWRDGEFIHTRCFTRDISERKRAEAAINEALAVKDEFIGLVSHELRTPLTTILGNAAILARRENAPDKESRVEAMNDLHREAVRLNNIVEDLLVLARLERGKIEGEPVALVRLVERSLRDQPEAIRRRVEVRVDGAAPIVSADESLIGHVITNYLSNAAKYSPPDTAIEVVVDCRDDQGLVRVLDRGIGFDAEEAEQLFDSFYRSANVGETSGMGIGLSVCRRLIEAVGGSCWAAPREGGGSEFGFSLPLDGS